jgi:D-alanine-D-alanine ligase
MTHILLVYNQPVLAADHPETDSETEILYTVEHVENSLAEAGYKVSKLAIGRDPSPLLPGLEKLKPDAVFNLFEGLPDLPDSEACLAGMLDWVNVPYTGSGPLTLRVARDKPYAKLALLGAGLPTPAFVCVRAPDDPALREKTLRMGAEPMRWPVIAKPADQDASVGIDQGSVVTSMKALRQRVEELHARFGCNVLVEEYIDGRELTVGVIEVPRRMALPPSEFVFERSEGIWPIVTYAAKWTVDSADFLRTPYAEVADVPTDWAERLKVLAQHAFDVMGLRDYGRVDFRVTASGELFILEVNPNPDLSPMAGLAGVLAAEGLEYAHFVCSLADRACSRGGRV